MMIKVVPPGRMVIVSNGRRDGIAIIATVFAMCLGSAWYGIDGLHTKSLGQAAAGLIGAVLMAAAIVAFSIPRNYKVGETYPGYRLNGNRLQTISKYALIITVAGLIVLLFFVKNIQQTVQVLGSGVTVLAGLYALSKSIPFHGDVDFSANEYLKTSLDTEVGEKILVSYQNFDGDDFKAGSNIFVVTATKILVAKFDGSEWSKHRRDLSTLSEIGIAENRDQQHFVKLIFTDGLQIVLKVELFEKMTSTPPLVIKRLLEAVDASILGASTVPQAARRRRVVADPDLLEKPVEQDESGSHQLSADHARTLAIDLIPHSDLAAPGKIPQSRNLEL